MMTESQNGKSNVPDPMRTWEKEVTERFRSLCANCGNVERLRAKMIVPLEAGGKLVAENGVLLCRSCDMASESVTSRPSEDQRLVNFWVSEKLFKQVKESTDRPTGFRSMGALVRFLISHYNAAPWRFDDLSLFQDDSGAADAKINVWVGRAEYQKFKDILDQNGWTVTDGIKSLLVLWHIDMFRNHLDLKEPQESGDK